jgi:hypothetical protein
MKLYRMLAIATATAFLVGAVAPAPVFAEMAKEAPKKAEKKETKKKALTPQQQKMKDCAGKWGQEKKAKKVSGRKAYNEFMSGCLKG